MTTDIISDKAYSQKNLIYGGLKLSYFEPQKSSNTFDETCLESSQDNNPQLIYL